MPPHGPGGDAFNDAAAQHLAHGGPFFPFFGGLVFLLFLLLVGATLFYLSRSGRLGELGAGRRRRPEDEAREILATRFASGDLSSDEFLERASVLNWTPGVEPLPVPRGTKRR
jgi:putative membrane protein